MVGAEWFEDVLVSRGAAVVVATNGMEWLPTGMPVDCVDLVVADGTQNQRVLQMLADAAGEVWQAALPLSADGPPEAEWTARLGSFIMAKHAAHTAHTAKEAS